MEALKLSSSLCHQAQGLLAIQRSIDAMMGKGRVPRVVVERADLRRVSAALRKAAEVADNASILVDGEVEVPVQA